MSGVPSGISSPAMRRAVAVVEMIDGTVMRFRRRSTRRLLAECRGALIELKEENGRLRRFIANDRPPFQPF